MVAENETNIWIAAADGNLAQVKQYIEVDGLDVDIKDENGYRALHAAVSYDHYELAKYLIEKKSNVNLGEQDLETPLHYCESLRCGKLLMENGADPNLLNSEGATPLDTALDEEKNELANFLKPLTTIKLPKEIKDELSHVDYEGNDNLDLNRPFVQDFERIMNDQSVGEEVKDAQLNDLVLNLLQDKLKEQ